MTEGETIAPRAYYNEHDPRAAAWLRELIAAGHIAPGVVDERSIADLTPNDLYGYTQCHFFAGIGGWSLALRLAGYSDARPVWTGSCPCQPFSAAGKGRGPADARHLWPVWRELIRACRPGAVFGEQVASAAVIGSTARAAKRKPGSAAEPVWLDGICDDLEAAHYACGAGDLPAASLGAPHRRQRLFWVAYAECGKRQAGRGGHRGEAGAQCEGGADADGCGGECGSIGVAYADDRECGGLANGKGGERDGPQAGREQGHGEPERGGATGGVADSADGGRPEHERESGRRNTTGPAGCGAGAWDSYDILPCRDGKARRVERGTFPLVARLPGPVVRGGDPGLPESHRPSPSIAEAKATAEGRVMRLRGYGNAIVPQVAAEFIRACEDARGD